jgi:hypothetical protein
MTSDAILEQAAQLKIVEAYHAVEEFSAGIPNPLFRDAILPGANKAYASILKSFQALLGRKDVRPPATSCRFRPAAPTEPTSTPIATALHLWCFLSRWRVSVARFAGCFGCDGSIPPHAPVASAPKRAAFQKLHAQPWCIQQPRPDSHRAC